MTVTEVVSVRNLLICVRWAILHWIRSFENVNVNKVNFFALIVLIQIANLLISMYTFFILTMRLSPWRKRVTKE